MPRRRRSNLEHPTLGEFLRENGLGWVVVIGRLLLALLFMLFVGGIIYFAYRHAMEGLTDAIGVHR